MAGPMRFDSLKTGAEFAQQEAKTIKETKTGEIKTERQVQKDKLEDFGKSISSLKEQLKTNQPLTSAQREILKKTEAIAHQLQGDRVALRSDVRDLGKDIRKAEAKMGSKMEQIQSDAKKIDKLSQKETIKSRHEAEAAKKSDRIQHSVEIIKTKHGELSSKQADLNDKIEFLNMQFKELRQVAQARLNLSALAHKEANQLSVVEKEFKATAKGLKGESIPEFYTNIKILGEKREALQKIQDELARAPLNRQDEGNFLLSQRREFQKVSKEILDLKKQIQGNLDNGEPKAPRREVMAHVFSRATTPPPQYSDAEKALLAELKATGISPQEHFKGFAHTLPSAPMQYTDFKKELEQESGEKLSPDERIVMVQKGVDSELARIKPGFIPESEISKLQTLAKMNRDHPELFKQFVEARKNETV